MILFSSPNIKLKKLQKKFGKKVYSLDLVAGWSCPFAKLCKSKVVGDRYGLKIKDGPFTLFRCYSASEEAIYKYVFLRRLKNYQTIKSLSKTPKKLIECINSSIPVAAQIIRLHVSGDFFSKNYMKAIIQVAKDNPDKEFYAYTKAIKYWIDLQKQIPDNFKLTASLGGTQDHLIQPFMKTAKVFNSKEEAEILNLEIDEDDSHAYLNNNSFALLVHGVQPSGHKIYKINRENKLKGKSLCV